MQDAYTLERIAQKCAALAPIMDERARRRWAAVEAASFGWGGMAAVADATGLSRNTVKCGLCELEYRQEHPKERISTRIRHAGGGRKRLTETDPALMAALEALVDPGPPAGIPNRRCVGRARARLSWRRSSLVRITR